MLLAHTKPSHNGSWEKINYSFSHKINLQRLNITHLFVLASVTGILMVISLFLVLSQFEVFMYLETTR